MRSRDPALRLDERFTHLVRMAGAVLLVGDDQGHLLESPLLGDVVRLVDGRRSATAIARALEHAHRPELVHFVLLKMERDGLLHAGPPPAPEPGQGSLPGQTGRVSTALTERLRVAWSGREARGAVAFTLEEGAAAGRTLLVSDDYLTRDLEEQRKAAVPEGEPCLLARVGSARVWVGPWILPGETPCIACLQERLRLNLMARAYLHTSAAAGGGDPLGIERLAREVPRPAFLRLAMLLVGEEVAPRNPGSLRVVTVADGAEEGHAVHRLPHCPACGEPDRGPAGAKIRLRPIQCAVRSGGGYRAKAPEETVSVLEPLVSPLTGVIRHVRKVPLERAGQVHVYTASHAHSFASSSLRTLRSDRRDHSGGKGMTDLEARASALCESVERYSSVYRGTEDVRVARLSELGQCAVPLHELLLFSETQYQERDAWNLQHGHGLHWVPEPYRDQPIEWSPARSLVSGETLWVPSAAVYLGFTGEGRHFCRGDSNGLASGNCLEEAILQGFLELVERDGVALWWYNRARLAEVDLGSFSDLRIGETRALNPELGRSLWALDLTTDLGIPTFTALSASADGATENIIFGFGAHLDPGIALLRALAELNQMLPTIERTPEERRRQLLPDFEEAIRWWETATLEGHPYLLPDPDRARRRQRDFPTRPHGDLLSAVNDCVARAQAVGCDVLVHDLTRPDVGFPVARVMAPGLRHFWRRLGPGRLYQVPVRLGWIGAARSEADMNPVSMFV
jgi:ribosomal protein S12 methylthiotransferase accessory factor